jgi:hypothetical protein
MKSNGLINSARIKKPTLKLRASRRKLASIRFRLAKNDEDIRAFFKKQKGNKSEWIKQAIRDRMEMGNHLSVIKAQLDFLVELLKLKGKEMPNE